MFKVKYTQGNFFCKKFTYNSSIKFVTQRNLRKLSFINKLFTIMMKYVSPLNMDTYANAIIWHFDR